MDAHIKIFYSIVDEYLEVVEMNHNKADTYLYYLHEMADEIFNVCDKPTYLEIHRVIIGCIDLYELCYPMY